MCSRPFTDMENEGGGGESSKVKWLDLELAVVGLCGAWTTSHPVLMPLAPATPALYTTPSCQAAAVLLLMEVTSHSSPYQGRVGGLCQRAAAAPAHPHSCHRALTATPVPASTGWIWKAGPSPAS